ncbi:hypothetical protein KJ654_03175 [Patescibacteria group bacterium]|nr:hypothetical protein [Patescibacteria group bacterium]MBU1966695.1 hypothetical protein [Patescibacteria group bacterium]
MPTSKEDFLSGPHGRTWGQGEKMRIISTFVFLGGLAAIAAIGQYFPSQEVWLGGAIALVAIAFLIALRKKGGPF